MYRLPLREGPELDATLRPGRPEDAIACGTICHEAFKAIASQHNFPPDFPSREVAVNILTMLLSHPGFYAVVAEADGRIVGSNFLDERSTIAGIGPITVEPSLQNSWCLEHGLHVVQVMTLMSIGLYNEPTGAYLPSVLY